MEYRAATADLSPDGVYRYRLSRVWDPALDTVTFCMLNPSTADAAQDDPTIRRCVGFARAWGRGGLVVVNLFAFRAADPAALADAADPVGPDNDAALERAAAGGLVVAAWGAAPAGFRLRVLRDRPAAVTALFRAVATLRHLGLTAGGHPRHPLYVPARASLLPFPDGKAGAA